jgi:hypothetical protein
LTKPNMHPKLGRSGMDHLVPRAKSINRMIQETIASQTKTNGSAP